MLTITKNGRTKKVSESVFKSVFKDSGWLVVGEQSPTPVISNEQVENNEEVNEVVENNEDENVEDEIPDEAWDEAVAEEEVEKPLSEMNREEMLAKAKELKITAVKSMTNKELREAIKEKM